MLIQKPEDKDIRHYLKANKDVTWSEEAINFLGNVADQRNPQKIKDVVDKYMIQRPPPRQVYADRIFDAKPPIQFLYPPFNSRQCTDYEKHYGPVLSISTSPFNKRLFLTSSTDGQIRLYDVQDKRPVALFETEFGEFINCVRWSLFRPSVFAAVSNRGTLYLYDLVQSRKTPVKVILCES